MLHLVQTKDFTKCKQEIRNSMKKKLQNPAKIDFCVVIQVNTDILNIQICNSLLFYWTVPN